MLRVCAVFAFRWRPGVVGSNKPVVDAGPWSELEVWALILRDAAQGVAWALSLRQQPDGTAEAREVADWVEGCCQFALGNHAETRLQRVTAVGGAATLLEQLAVALAGRGCVFEIVLPSGLS